MGISPMNYGDNSMVSVPPLELTNAIQQQSFINSKHSNDIIDNLTNESLPNLPLSRIRTCENRKQYYEEYGCDPCAQFTPTIDSYYPQIGPPMEIYRRYYVRERHPYILPRQNSSKYTPKALPKYLQIRNHYPLNNTADLIDNVTYQIPDIHRSTRQIHI
ncbi:hypothetical protein SNEBB_010955 [Seison nebaliae]|nr:hypothetical protein SNEBB_010955 [Seison nebaliae]